MSRLEEQRQVFKGYEYSICDLIEASKDLEVFKIKVCYLGASAYMPPHHTDDFEDFAKHAKRTMEADLKYPIILSPDGVILDGKHRLAKAIANNIDELLAVQFLEMPKCGYAINE
tara:strand:+ start:1695 stop:2039 length:345 start_codon:yes stop_codon:yes gene_type:complete